MKKFNIIAIVFILVSASFLSSCKKKENEPEPGNNNNASSPSVNTPSTTAPSLNSGAAAALTVFSGPSNATGLNLSTLIADPQGDIWTITSVTSSNTSIASVSISGTQSIEYTGNSSGSSTLTIIVADASGNTNTITFSLTVSATYSAPFYSSGSTSLTIQDGSNAEWDLTTRVTEPQGDDWSILSVTSANTAVATVSLASSKLINYVGIDAGTSIMTVVIADDDGNESSFTIAIVVTPKPIGGGDGGGPK